MSTSSLLTVSWLLTIMGRRRELFNHLPDRRGLLASTIDHFHRQALREMITKRRQTIFHHMIAAMTFREDNRGDGNAASTFSKFREIRVSLRNIEGHDDRIEIIWNKTRKDSRECKFFWRSQQKWATTLIKAPS